MGCPKCKSTAYYIADFVSKEYHKSIKKVKDLTAATIFVAAIVVAIIDRLFLYLKL